MQSMKNMDGKQIARAVGAVAITAGVAMLAWPKVRAMTQRWRIRHPQAEKEPAVDKVLKDSFPASDPPASRYFDIPVNRQ